MVGVKSLDVEEFAYDFDSDEVLSEFDQNLLDELDKYDQD